MPQPPNLFERKATICYCVPNGSSLCAPCRQRRLSKSITGSSTPIEPNLPLAPKIVPGWYDHDKQRFYPNVDLSKYEFRFQPEHYELTEGDTCPNCGKHHLAIDHTLDGCSCHINPPCSYCTESSLWCKNCDLYIEIPDA